MKTGNLLKQIGVLILTVGFLYSGWSGFSFIVAKNDLAEFDYGDPKSSQANYSPDGQKILTFSRKSFPSLNKLQTKVWNSSTGQKIFEIESTEQNGERWNEDFADSSWSLDSQKIMWSSNGLIHVYDFQSQKKLFSIESGWLGDRWFKPLWSPDSQRIATMTLNTVSEENEFTVYSAMTGEKIFVFDLEDLYQDNRKVVSANWSPDGKYLLLQSRNSRVNSSGRKSYGFTLWNAQNGKRSPRNHLTSYRRSDFWQVRGAGYSDERIPPNLSKESTVVWSPNGDQFYAHNDYTTLIGNVKTGEIVGLGEARISDGRSDLNWSPDGQYFVAFGATDSLKKRYDAIIWNTTTWKIIKIIKDVFILNRKITSPPANYVLWSSDGQRLFFAISPNSEEVIKPQIKAYNAHTGKELFTLKCLASSMDSSPNGKYLLIGNYRQIPSDDTAKLYDASTGQKTLTLNEKLSDEDPEIMAKIASHSLSLTLGGLGTIVGVIFFIIGSNISSRLERQEKMIKNGTTLLEQKVWEQIDQGLSESDLKKYLVDTSDSFFIGTRMTLSANGTLEGGCDVFIPSYEENVLIPAETATSILRAAYTQLSRDIHAGSRCQCHSKELKKPTDEVVSKSYQHENKNGEPDRRKNPKDNLLTQRRKATIQCAKCGEKWVINYTEQGIHDYKGDNSFNARVLNAEKSG